MKPPNDTPRPEQLNQIIRSYIISSVVDLALVFLELENPVHCGHAVLSFAPLLCELQQSRRQFRQFSRQSRGSKR